MEILGIGPLELMLILLIALIVLGPNDMVKAGKTLGQWMRKIVTSPYWNMIQQTSKDFRYLPNKLMREAGLEEEMKNLGEIKSNVQNLGSQLQGDLAKLNQEVQKDMQGAQSNLSAWITPPVIPSPPPPYSTPFSRAMGATPANVPDAAAASPENAPEVSTVQASEVPPVPTNGTGGEAATEEHPASAEETVES